jgi:hypothetical protein
MPSERKSKQSETEFRELVNMSAEEIERWLQSPKSKKVGMIRDGGTESVGHQSGRKIANILRMSPHELKDSDLTHMAKVVAYIRRHSAQKPQGDVEDTPWRYSLMNWGHDPLKVDGKRVSRD